MSEKPAIPNTICSTLETCPVTFSLEDGREKRAAAETQLAQIENEMRQKLLEMSK